MLELYTSKTEKEIKLTTNNTTLLCRICNVGYPTEFLPLIANQMFIHLLICHKHKDNIKYSRSIPDLHPAHIIRGYINTRHHALVISKAIHYITKVIECVVYAKGERNRY